MASNAEHPWLGYRLYEVYHSKEDRWYAQLVSADHRTTTALARYRLSVKLGRKLLKTEQVDHIDENRRNDSVGNLQILTPVENREKYQTLCGIEKLTVQLRCAVCGRLFERNVSGSNGVGWRMRQGSAITCSRECGYVKLRKQ